MPDLLGPIIEAGAPAAEGLFSSAAPAIEGALSGGPSVLGTAADTLAAGAGGLDVAGGFGAAADAAAAAAGGSGLASGLGDIVGGIGSIGPSFFNTAADTLAAGAGGLDTATGFGPAADAAASTAATTGQATGLNTAGIGSLASPASTQPLAFGGVSSTASPGTGGADTAISSKLTTPSSGFPSPNVSPAAPSATGLAPSTGITTPVDATAAAGGVSGTGGEQSIWDKLLGGAQKSVTSNPLGIGLGAAGLGYNILQGQKLSANEKALTSAAQTAAGNSNTLTNAALPIANQNNATGNQLIQSGEALQSYLTTGQLPAQYQSQIDQAINDAKTNAISNAAKNGQNTDPTQNTTLAQTLAGIDNQRANMTTQVASQLFQSGSSNISAGAGLTENTAGSLLSAGSGAAGLSGQLYQSLVQMDQKQAAQTAQAIGQLAQALNSSGNKGMQVPGTNVQVSQPAV